MAQKAAKSQAQRNTAIIKRLQLLSLGVHGLFILLRFLVFRSSGSRSTYLLYFLLGGPSAVIVILFQRNSSPTYAPNGDLKKPGDDLEAKGLTEYLFDILYWTWGTIALAAIFGDRAWWAWAAIPLYSMWLAYSTFGSVRQGMAGLTGQGTESVDDSGPSSNRQKKLEKRGGQRMQYR